MGMRRALEFHIAKAPRVREHGEQTLSSPAHRTAHDLTAGVSAWREEEAQQVLLVARMSDFFLRLVTEAWPGSLGTARAGAMAGVIKPRIKQVIKPCAPSTRAVKHI